MAQPRRVRSGTRRERPPAGGIEPVNENGLDSTSKKLKRSCIFVATTNAGEFLTDRTGNRRWIPVDCGVSKPYGDIHSDKARAVFENAWAYAVKVYKEEHPALVLPDNVKAEIEERCEASMEEDPMVGQIQAYLDGIVKDNVLMIAPERYEGGVCSKQIVYEGLLYPDPLLPRDEKRVCQEVSSIMNNKIHGWKNAGRMTFSEYGQQRCWQPVPGGE